MELASAASWAENCADPTRGFAGKRQPYSVRRSQRVCASRAETFAAQDTATPINRADLPRHLGHVAAYRVRRGGPSTSAARSC